MKIETKINTQLHIEGYASDIFTALSNPELKNQYESYLSNNEPLFDDEPDYRVGAVHIDSINDLVKTILALGKAAKKLALYVSSADKESGAQFNAFIGDNSSSYCSGAEIKINESLLTEGIRTAATSAYKTLGESLKIGSVAP